MKGRNSKGNLMQKLALYTSLVASTLGIGGCAYSPNRHITGTKAGELTNRSYSLPLNLEELTVHDEPYFAQEDKEGLSETGFLLYSAEKTGYKVSDSGRLTELVASEEDIYGFKKSNKSSVKLRTDGPQGVKADFIKSSRKGEIDIEKLREDFLEFGIRTARIAGEDYFVPKKLGGKFYAIRKSGAELNINPDGSIEIIGKVYDLETLKKLREDYNLKKEGAEKVAKETAEKDLETQEEKNLNKELKQREKILKAIKEAEEKAAKETAEKLLLEQKPSFGVVAD